MIGLLTWPAYGTWFAYPGRGWIDRDRNHSSCPIPEPTRRSQGRRALKWPPVRLDDKQRGLIIDDLARIAALRRFELRMAVAAADHIHILLSCEEDRDVPRLVQLIKGALSRALTVAAGDEPARSTRGRSLPHHKWWTRQYSFVRLGDPDALKRVIKALLAHRTQQATVWQAPGH